MNDQLDSPQRPPLQSETSRARVARILGARDAAHLAEAKRSIQRAIAEEHRPPCWHDLVTVYRLTDAGTKDRADVRAIIHARGARFTPSFLETRERRVTWLLQRYGN